MGTIGEPLIKLEGIKKVFYTDEVETHALAEVHLEIQQGEYIAIAGPSGCGKTTLLSILGLLDTPSEGGYSLDGRSVAGLDAAERARVRNRQIGFIFQAFNLIGDLTVYENVELPLTYRGMSSSERKDRVHAALERVGMAHRVKHFPAQLSGGQQQRVAVARAVAGDPAILLADEPTGNLDLRQRRSGDGAPPGAASQWCDDLHGHPRSPVRSACRPVRASLRWPRCGREDSGGGGDSVTEKGKWDVSRAMRNSQLDAAAQNYTEAPTGA